MDSIYIFRSVSIALIGCILIEEVSSDYRRDLIATKVFSFFPTARIRSFYQLEIYSLFLYGKAPTDNNV